MSNENKFTPEEAQAWVDSRVWANGWNVNADATVNAVEFAEQYAANKDLWDKLFAFLAEADIDNLPLGKHVLVEDRLWVNIMEYTPKNAESTRTESHNKFIDLQYTFDGADNELYGVPVGRVTPTQEYDPVKDRTFFTPEEEVSYVPAGRDRFFLYFPGELHQPSVAINEPAKPARKAVGKIEYAKL